MIDRKRKFLDTDLAHDSEGREAVPSVVTCSNGSQQKLTSSPQKRNSHSGVFCFQFQSCFRISVNFKRLG